MRAWDLVFPVHPRTSLRLHASGAYDRLEALENVRLLPPLGYAETLGLIRRARLVLTDSGGIQEEACILNTPCVTLRDNTERPETVEVGANEVAGVRRENVVRAVARMLSVRQDWPNPFGDGRAAERMVDVASDSRCIEWQGYATSTNTGS